MSNEHLKSWRSQGLNKKKCWPATGKLGANSGDHQLEETRLGSQRLTKIEKTKQEPLVPKPEKRKE